MAKVFTIGHSNRKWSEFVSTLKDNHIDVVVDVRRYTGSRKCPQFNKEQMVKTLKTENVSYGHIEKLVEDESRQISQDLDTLIITTIVDGKTRALEPMLIIWPRDHLKKVFMRYFHL